MIIRDFFHLKNVKRGSMLVNNRKVGAEINLPKIDSERLVGIEVEVENFRVKEGEGTLDRVWTSKNDGSLRNEGLELVTSPIPANQAPFALYNLLEQTLSKDCCFSPRTSIHVHVNVQEEEEAQVKNLILWYALFEPLFYRFTGRGRQKNIYCVPLMDTDLLRGFLSSDLNQILGKWSKYSGLNLLPLAGFGTVEWRHMHGTFSYEKTSLWIRMIVKLVDFVRMHEVNYHLERLHNCNETTDYNKFLFEIFGEDATLLQYKEPKDLQTTMHLIKLAFVSMDALNLITSKISLKAPFFN